MERLKNEEDQNIVDVYLIERLRLELAFICTYVQLSYSDLEQFEVVMTAQRQRIEELLRSILYDADSSAGFKFDMHHVLPRFLENIDDCINSCHHSTSSTTMTEEQLNVLLVNLLHLFKHQYLEEQMPSLASQYEILQNMCGNVGDFHGLILNGCVEHDNVEYVLPQFQRMAERVGLFLWDELILENSSVFKLAHLLMKIFPIELEVMSVCFTNLKTSTSAEVGCFVKQLLEASTDILREYLIHLQEHMVTVIIASTSGARNIHVMIEFLLIILTDMPKDFIHHDKLFYLLARVGALIREVSTLIHDLEEKSRNEESTDERSSATLDLLEEKLELLKEDLEHPVERKSLTAGKIIVGFVDETDWIIRKLTSGPAALDVISIIGMPGSGKTTLAYKVYNDKSVCSHFDVRAWCTVYQEYDEKKFLVRFFNQVTGSDLKFSGDIDVADKLRKQLYGKRYLIVLDDVWDIDTWDELTRPFPEVVKGSRIILTTRQKEVALHGKGSTDPLNLRLLNPEESWELLEKTAFGEQSCPDELLDVGKEIAQNCKGLPLVADLIAGVILGLEKEKTVWLEVRNNLRSFILNSEVDVMKVIELSYDRLPHHLKPCLIYLASFPKDTTIDKDMLKMFWRTEGLVEQTEMKSVKEVMEVYFDNLISSSLVITLNEIGKCPTCQIHDLVHDFCFIKAREEKLFGRISSSDASSSSDLMPRIVNIDYKKEHFELNNFVLCSSKMKRHSGKHLYSLRITGDEMEDLISDICHLRHLRLLRVLFLQSSFMMVKDSLLNEICLLNHLRFLYIGTKVKSLPPSFSNLWNLETLNVENKGSTMVLLPSIWDLVKLRLLSMSAGSFFDLDTDEPILIAEDSKLENLRYLGKLVLSYLKDKEDIFRRFSNLQELSFVLKES
ncbi:hypothetical protein CQW23_13963 [Capsicum baccatum]|uniref:Uncharacterized protein n=1 Tax=Capsicum baccatum TaxID=33114 RepID=A0A2G2WHT3_CAPBA|nr:hypothetical protein CQW23_13963 [Capsicum baccatum]